MYIISVLKLGNPRSSNLYITLMYLVAEPEETPFTYSQRDLTNVSGQNKRLSPEGGYCYTNAIILLLFKINKLLYYEQEYC